MSTAGLFSLNIELCIISITFISVAFTLQPKLLIKQVSKWVNERGQVLYLSHIVQSCYIPNFIVMASILQDLLDFSWILSKKYKPVSFKASIYKIFANFCIKSHSVCKSVVSQSMKYATCRASHLVLARRGTVNNQVVNRKSSNEHL